MRASYSFTLATAAIFARLASYDYDASNLPAKTDAAHGQKGFNDCQKRYGATSPGADCQNIFLNSVKDFCLYAPRSRGPSIGDVEEEVVSYCMKSGYGTRLIPDGTITGAHFVKTPSFVQITGVGDLTKINVRAKDEGGELDPHGASGAGNPIGGLVFTRAFTGNFQQIHEWQHFISYNEFCFRACIGPYADRWCPHVYDEMGCSWNEPGNYAAGSFDQCDGSEGEWPGVYNGKQWFQGQKPEPPAQKAGEVHNCRNYQTIGNGPAKKVP